VLAVYTLRAYLSAAADVSPYVATTYDDIFISKIILE